MSDLHNSSECCTPAFPLTTLQRTEFGLIPVSPRHTHSPIDMSVSVALLEPLARLSSKRAQRYHEDTHTDEIATPILKIDTAPGALEMDTLSSDLRAFGPVRQRPEMNTIPLSGKYADKDITWDLDYSASNDNEEGGAAEPKPKVCGAKGSKSAQRLMYSTPRVPLDINNSCASASDRFEPDTSSNPNGNRPVMIFDSLHNSPAAETTIARAPSVLSLSHLPLLDNASSYLDTTELSRLLLGNEDVVGRAPSCGAARATL